MTDLTYLNFDLHYERAANGYRVEANGPAGFASGAIGLPFSELKIENFVLKLGHTGRGMRRIDAPEVAAAKAFGARLFDSVFAGDLRACLQSSLDEAGHHNAGLRIRVRLSDAPELADLPWEYLYHSAMNRFLPGGKVSEFPPETQPIRQIIFIHPELALRPPALEQLLER